MLLAESSASRLPRLPDDDIAAQKSHATADDLLIRSAVADELATAFKQSG
jgi:hypothetical protein